MCGFKLKPTGESRRAPCELIYGGYTKEREREREREGEREREEQKKWDQTRQGS